ncbi:Fic family protein [Mucilaginibacter sp. E4BP6]|uniref:Fic family protein n=1 Tax=Mucilaginibacter sp. E4BP6 TaxID=2723089 RepID=UPI0015CBFE42|nr:Fic family protein [Mucilaginibacter sp. E4BP6]NYE66270.1 Fic family protein [Mucilaginibacter sp. E4BP6]
MNLKLEFEFNKTDIIKDVEALKNQVDALRPLPADVEGKVMQKLRLDWNYHSNAIEGNRLNYGETVAFLMEGITAKGKPLKDHLDIRGHNDAINFLLEIVKDTRSITEADIRALHKMILVEPYDSPATTADGLPTTKRIALGEYKTSPNHVKTSTGEIHYYASPAETPARMHDLMDWYEEFDRYDISPIIIAALFHHKFVEIHPFDDGNGRLSRILMNLILMQSGYPPVVVKTDDRKNYYSLLSRADVGDTWPFVEYVAELMQSSLQLYLKAARGVDIDEDDDIDKEIALFKMQVRENSIYKEKKSFKIISNIIVDIIDPIVKDAFKKAEKFDELFTKSNRSIIFQAESFSDFNQNLLNFISSRYQKFDKMEISFSYSSFKSMRNVFDLSIKQTIKFNLYEYKILDNQNKLIITKQYHEPVSNIEKKEIIKVLIRDIKDQITLNLDKQKSPKP